MSDTKLLMYGKELLPTNVILTTLSAKLYSACILGNTGPKSGVMTWTMHVRALNLYVNIEV